MNETSTSDSATSIAGYTSADTVLRLTVAMIFVYSTKRRRTASRLPLRSPARSDAVYTRGNRSPWAAKASDSAVPERTRSWTSSSTCRSVGVVTRPLSRSRDCTRGMPALSSVASSWLKTRNSRVLIRRRCGSCSSEIPAIAPFWRRERTNSPLSSRSCRSRASFSATYTPSTISPLGDASRHRNSTLVNCINLCHASPGSLDHAAERKAGRGCAGLPLFSVDEFQDVGDVLSRFRVWRNPAETPDGGLAGVVRGEGERQLESIEQRLQILDPRLDVRLRLVRVGHRILPGRFGHELHQPDRAFPRSRALLIPRFDPDHRPDQLRRHAFPRRDQVDDFSVAWVRRQTAGERWRRRARCVFVLGIRNFVRRNAGDGCGFDAHLAARSQHQHEQVALDTVRFHRHRTPGLKKHELGPGRGGAEPSDTQDGHTAQCSCSPSITPHRRMHVRVYRGSIYA